MKKEMLINVLQPEECRIAIIEDGVLEELYLERTSHESYTGNIYKGKIVNLEPAIQAAFVDFSVGRNGFLHVSDVEPQYYRKHLGEEGDLGPRDRARDPRRDFEEPRRDRDRERERDRDRERPPEGRSRDRDRERPDRSEKGRRDRTPRRFGEGLTDDEAWTPPTAEPPTRATEPPSAYAPPPQEDETRAHVPSDEDTALWIRERREPEAEQSVGWSKPSVPEPFDFEAELPPSRTHRQRVTPQPPSTPSPALDEITELLRPGPIPPARPIESEPEFEPRLPAPEARRHRGRGRGVPRPVHAPPPEPSSSPVPAPAESEPAEFEPTEPIAEFAPSPAPPPHPSPEIDAILEPLFDEPPDSGPRRGGRSAIRARGGDRPAPPERPRVPATGREEDLDRPRRDRDRGVDRPRISDLDRPRPHARAGEPGYVPRRERSRPGELPFGVEPPSMLGPGGEPRAGRDHVDEDDVDRSSGLEGDETELLDEGPGAPTRPEGPRRRRRRRGRRRGRDERLESDSAAPSLGEEPLAEADESSRIAPRSLPPRRPREPLARRGADLDFDDEVLDEELEAQHELDEEPRIPSPDDEIDPELEDEIRREIDEIAELEREMGLRGPVEARPRRGDERAEPLEPIRSPGRSARGRGLVKPPIQEIFRRGDEVLIQVIKESIGTKGPTLSTYISIPGRYLVLMPGLNRVGVSRKIADEAQRRKLREIMNELNPPKGLGFIVRTAGLDRSKRELARDLAYLLRLWKVILRRIKKARSPAPIYQESDMITRTIRDIFSSDIDTIWIDEPTAFERAQEFLRIVMPKFVDRLKYYDGKVPLFHKYGIEDEIAKIQRRRIDLPHGGSIVIDQTEALVAIDVNSGNFRVEDDAERTAYEMNIRAAKEIARQLRLRDLGGVICNDFIDMRDERNRRGVERAIREAVKRDRARTKILRMSQFGIIEMTRQRIRPSLKRSVYEDCAHCTGAGVVKTVESMSIDVMRLLALAAHREEIRRINITVSAAVATHLNNKKRRDITRIENDSNMVIHIRHEDHVPAEHLQIDCFDAQNNEIRLIPASIAHHGPPPRRGR
jgi:ribonuclease E